MTAQKRVPQLFVEQLARGELSADRAQAVREALAAEPGGLARLDEIARSDQAILRELPPERVVREVQARAKQASWRPVRAVWLPVLVAASALLVVGRGPWVAPPDPVDRPVGEVRVKGLAPELRVYRSEAGEVRRLLDDEQVSEGDLLQLAYVVPQSMHGVIVSVDGRGVVTLHHPEHEGGSTWVEAGGEVRLPHAYELDDAPKFERFLLLTSAEPIEVEAVMQWAERAGERAGPPSPAMRLAELRVTKAGP